MKRTIVLLSTLLVSSVCSADQCEDKIKLIKANAQSLIKHIKTVDNLAEAYRTKGGYARGYNLISAQDDRLNAQKKLIELIGQAETNCIIETEND